ncbi:hypothetical protein HDU98_002864 [Podochytrium sp. JEL0797]|nr:hypothetical protein HDU98_002864 [Podochytrium sp. JEL0797]
MAPYTPTAEAKAQRAAIKQPVFDIASDNATGSYFAALVDGHRVYYHVWKPTGPIKAQILFFHGLGEHIRRYDHVFSKFAAKGILVKGMDWRGHGRTVFRNANGRKGFHESYEQVFADMLQLNSIEVDGMVPGVPLFVAGHSMGGLLALSFVHHHKEHLPNLRGVISQAPALSLPKPVPFLARILATWFGAGWLGKIVQPNELELNGLCSSETVIQDYLKDPLVHGMISLRLVRDMLVHSELLKRLSKRFTTPLIIYHSEGDRFTSAKGAELFVNECGSKDKIFKGFAGQSLEHELHNEPAVKEAIIDEYVAWIDERSK